MGTDAVKTSPLLPAIENALKNLNHGHVQIVVHDGKVVRIERVEKIHLPPTGYSGGCQTLSS